ncbi:MAG TPA: hypothetical protein VF120_04825 [Ktedonobacterales bacterium]
MSTPHLQRPQAISDDTRRAFLSGDREDLLAVLALRFGTVPASVQTRIAACDDAATLERLILVAANVPDWDTFLHELDAGSQAFKLVGASYEPNTAESGLAATPGATREPRLPDEAQPKGE